MRHVHLAGMLVLCCACAALSPRPAPVFDRVTDTPTNANVAVRYSERDFVDTIHIGETLLRGIRVLVELRAPGVWDVKVTLRWHSNHGPESVDVFLLPERFGQGEEERRKLRTENAQALSVEAQMRTKLSATRSQSAFVEVACVVDTQPDRCFAIGQSYELGFRAGGDSTTAVSYPLRIVRRSKTLSFAVGALLIFAFIGVSTL